MDCFPARRLRQGRASVKFFALTGVSRGTARSKELIVADDIDGRVEEYRERLERHTQADINSDVERHREDLQSSHARYIQRWVDDFREGLEAERAS